MLIHTKSRLVNGKLNFIFPLVCTPFDEVSLKTDLLRLKNSRGTLVFESNYPLGTPIPVGQRVYNFIPGLQAYPIEIECSELHKKKLLVHLST